MPILCKNSQDETIFEQLCGEILINTTALLNQTIPNLSNCFQKIILQWPLFLVTILNSCFVLWRFHGQRKDKQPLPFGFVISSKIIIPILIGASELSDLLIDLFLYPKSCFFIVDLVSPLLIFSMTIMISATEIFQRRKAIRMSAMISLIWFLFLILSIPDLYSISLNLQHQKIKGTIHVVKFCLIFVSFVLSSCVPLKNLEEDPNACPKKNAFLISQIVYGWFWSMAITGWRRSLTRNELWTLEKGLTSQRLVAIWEQHWKNLKISRKSEQPSQKERVRYSSKTGNDEEKGLVESDLPKVRIIDLYVKMPSIPKTLFFCFKWDIVISAVINLGQVALQFVAPMILKLVLGYLQDPQEPLWFGVFLSLVMFIASTAQSFAQQQSMNIMFVLGLKVKTVLTAAIYKKSLKLSPIAKRDLTIGEIVNRMSVDVQRIIDVAPWVHMIWSTPLQIILALIFLNQILGWAAFIGFAMTVILIPLNFVLSKKQRQYQITQMKFKDNRIKLMNEIISGIKVIKLYAWEPPFEKQVASVRQKELEVLRKSAVITAWNSFTMYCSPFLISVASFAAFTLSSSGNVLTPQVAFVSLALFNILRAPMNFLPAIIAMLVQAGVSNGRIKSFLCLDEIDEKSVKRTFEQAENAVEIEKARFVWDTSSSSQAFQLGPVDLSIPDGKLIAVIGQVGEGKSSLISAILGEMQKVSGEVKVNGTVAYVPQQAWIQNSTLKQNIVFTRSFDKKLYDKVINACALSDDMTILPDGDSTEIGEKGINLSGGQKQRVSLARAVYQNRDIYLMDDPLSAVDAHVGKHIFQNVLSNKNGLLRKKTRIIVTHSTTFLKETDLIVVMKNGQIIMSGTFDYLQNNEPNFAEFVRTYMTQKSQHSESDETPTSQKSLRSQSISSIRRISLTNTLSECGSSIEEDEDENGVDLLKKKTKYGTEKLLQKDDKVAVGKVLMSVYKYYFSAIGYWICLFVMFCYVVSTALGIGSSLWLAAWSSSSANDNNFNQLNNSAGTTLIAKAPISLNARLGIYFFLGIGQGASIFLATILTCYATVAASTRLHKSALHALLRSPMSFFDVTPLGAIVNRVGKDVDVMDNTVPDSMRSSLLAFLQVLTSLVIVMISTPIAVLVILPMGVLYYVVQKFYINTARQLKRLESASRSPIFSFFGETVSGVSSIRAYHVQENFVDECLQKIDHNQMAYYPSLVATRWLAIYLQFIGNFIVLGAMLFAVIYRTSNAEQAGLVGLSVTYAMTITLTLMMAVRTASDLETNIVAVERLKEYTELPSERPWIETIRPPPNWPSSGKVEFVNYFLRYKPEKPLVLKHINCSIQPQEKLGIVGRTGAGKSSLSMGLFRLVEPDQGSKIMIDCVDICQIGLHDLRSKLAIIPQEPILFSGTLRMNLDPFEVKTDGEIWQSLEQCYLKTFVGGLPEQLNYLIQEGGENLSVGQRQLICLARALLRKSKILIFDEATAAVDMETESSIQKTISQAFAQCTMLTIAHRLNTIYNSDRIMVLECGVVKELDSPQALVQNKESAFYKMAKDAKIIN